jgi:hypothetical protein
LAVIDNLLLLVLDVTLLHLQSPLLQTLWRHKIKRPTTNPPKKSLPVTPNSIQWK